MMNTNSTYVAKAFLSRLDIAGAKKAVQELANFLVENRSQNQLDEILQVISREYTAQTGVVEASAKTAFPLSEKLKQELVARVKKSTNAKVVIFHEEVDKSLLGGAVLSAPDMELDLSIKTKLAKLRA